MVRLAGASIAAVLVAGCYQSTTLPDAGPPVDQAGAFIAARAAELCRRAIGCERRSFDPLWSEIWCHPDLMPLSRDRVENVASGPQRFDPVHAEECLRILTAILRSLDETASLPLRSAVASGPPR